MKKILAMVINVALVMSLFTACGSKSETVKTGLAVISSADYSSKDAGDADGLAQVDSTAVAVLVDSKGVIRNCAIDVVQTKINFNNAGEITTDLASTFDSKQALGDAYDMKKASAIGKEWFEQANALADYVKGKTVAEVKGIALEDGYAAEEDLKSSVTMEIGSMIDAIEKAVNNAQDLGAHADDKLGLGIIGGIGQFSANASADKDGVAQAESHYGVVTLDKGGKITSSIIDASQSSVTFSAEGIITSDLSGADFKTKVELGDAYDMKKASSIGKEWYEQAKAFSDYIKGKTVADVKGIALDDSSKPTSDDLKSSVTVSIGEFLTAIDRAGAAAK
jgi:ABC-type transporter Mla MlaB component